MATCYNCNGEGWEIICCDDMCRGAGECFHTDGERVCPVCQGEGYIGDEYEDEDVDQIEDA